jgi:cytochrome b561
MVIWRGLGIIVVIVAVGTLALTEYAVNAMSGDSRYYQTHEWPKLIGVFLAGLLVLVIGRYLNNKSEREAKVVIDEETGEKVVLKVEHSLFFINVKYWGYIIFALGIIFFSFSAAATPVTAQQRKSDRPHSKNIRRKHRTATYPEHYGSVWDQSNKPGDNYPTECVIYAGKRFLALWESLQNAPISSAFSERMPQSRVSRARGVGRSSGCWLSRSSAV